MEVDIFIPCFIDQIYPEIGFSTVKVLEKAGCKPHYNPKQTCCGQPLFNSGYRHDASKLAVKFINEFSGERYIVTPGASCAGYIKTHFHTLFSEQSHREHFKILQPKVIELTDFLINILGLNNFEAEFNEKVTFHTACSALREYGLKDEPFQLLKKVKGLTLLELEHSDTCCGFGGTFAVKQTAISQAMAEQKVQNAIATGASYITSTEASCLMNVEGYIKKQKLNIKTIHIAQILAH
ncbi:MAG: (Fe-S)-binding protein [Bacteroidales bacterium]